MISNFVSLDNMLITYQNLINKLQSGLSLTEIENVLAAIIIFRFITLSIKYNVKTGFYIICIGLFSAYLWYRHLIDLVALYRTVLIQLPYLSKLGFDGVELMTLSQQSVLKDMRLGDDVNWYNPGKLLYYAFTNGILRLNKVTGISYYIDPISMIVSNLDEPDKSNILPTYYKIYNKIIPTLFSTISEFWSQLSRLASYSVIVRIGKKYCPYLVRWHWTFLMILNLFEDMLTAFILRVGYYQGQVLIPMYQDTLYHDSGLILEIEFLNALVTFITFTHFALIFFGMFHAVWGQYFYVPFLVENTELHVGRRPKNTVYSGGKTSWQDERKINVEKLFPKFWFGFFGRGTNEDWKVFLKVFGPVINVFGKVFGPVIQKVKIFFRKIRKGILEIIETVF